VSADDDPPASASTRARDEEIEAAFLELRREFALTLPAKLRELEESVRGSRARPSDKAAWELARQTAHRLRGTAGTYGFEEEGEAAGVIEDALATLAQPQTDPDAQDRAWADIARALESIAAR
jgi:chemotaxis protein histidine kinase CheA